jgi:hypothetical protein
MDLICAGVAFPVRSARPAMLAGVVFLAMEFYPSAA